VAIPANRNVTQKEAEEEKKVSCIQMQQMWNTECMITPKITGATISNKSLKRIWKSHQEDIQ
jgi:hypothetical protein